MTRLALRGLATRKLRTALTVARDPARRRDDLRHVRADGHDQTALRRHLPAVQQGHRRRRLARRPAFDATTATSAARRARVARREGRAPSPACSARPASARRPARLVVNGKALKPTGGAPAIVGRAPARFNAADKLVAGPLPRRPSRGRRRHEARRRRTTCGSATRVQVATHAGLAAGHDRRHRQVRRRRLARRRDVHRRHARRRRSSGSTSRARLDASSSRGAAGVSPAELDAARRARRSPADVRCRPACRTRGQRPRTSTTRSTASSRPALLAFGFVAVLVGAFIIFNTFTITVAQRMREFAHAAHARRRPPPGPARRDRARRS